MANPLPSNNGQIYDKATQNYEGIVAQGAAIPFTMVTTPEMLAKRDAFKNAGDSFGTARNSVHSAYQVFKPAMLALHTWLVTVRAVLARRIGERWSAAWAAAGYPGPTTQVPDTAAEQISLGVSLKAYYTANPTFEVPTLDVTADKADELTTAAVTAQNAVNTAEAALTAAGQTRETARTNVLGAMSSLIANLNKKLPKNDPRWHDFGLRMPSTRTTPPAPTGLRATVMGSQILLECDATGYATRYRFRRKIVGVDAKYKLVASSRTPMAMLEGVAAGLTMEIIAQAVNGNSQGVACNPILVTTPEAMAAKAAPAPAPATDEELAPLAAIGTNGNGCANGNGNGSHLASRVG
ncbi:MAG: hypothetical protein ABIU29_05915 [Chthoniobacterales bacterium]